MNSIILPGTTIGLHCVVGAGSVVKGDIAGGTVIAGNPARFLKTTDELLAEIEKGPHRLDTWRLDGEERERRLKAHFGIDAPLATAATPLLRPRGPLR